MARLVTATPCPTYRRTCSGPLAAKYGSGFHTPMWGFITFLIGIAYGFFAKGRQDKSRLFMTGLLIGLVLAIIFGLLGGLRGLGLPGGFLGILLTALILTILFVIGVWIGDMLEGRSGRTSTRRNP